MARHDAGIIAEAKREKNLLKTFGSGVAHESNPLTVPPMSARIYPFPSVTEDDGQAVFSVPLDDATVARLLEVADMAHADPAIIIASIVRDVLEDDERAHLLEPETEPVLN